MPEVYISFQSPLRSLSRWEIEEDLEDLIGSRGDISGGGEALDGSAANIDLYLHTENKRDTAKIVTEIVDLLRELAVPAGTTLHILQENAEQRRPVYDKSFPRPVGPPASSPIRPGTKAKTRPSNQPLGDLPAVGDALLFKVPGVGTLTVCRVLRIVPGSSHPVQLAATNWFGKKPPDLADKRLKEPLKLSYVGARGAWRSWVRPELPDNMRKLGTIRPTKEEREFCSSNHSSCETFLRTIASQFKFARLQQAKGK
jgi:hypothetical protein